MCIVTGATSGIGKATALGLARQQANVVLIARNRAKGEVARQEIQTASGNQAVDLLLADLSSQASIHQLAATTTERYPQIHMLVNNAGVFMLKRHETIDGLEMTFASIGLELAFCWRNLLYPITSKHAMSGTASIQASLCTLVKAHPAYFRQ